MPATPKSSNGERGSNENDSENMDVKVEEQQQQPDAEKKADGENFELPEETKFVLAPTPAQLGKAPLQRRLANNSLDQTKGEYDLSSGHSPSSSGTANLSPAINDLPTPNSATIPPQSADEHVQQQHGGAQTPGGFGQHNQKKKAFLKKVKSDDMDA